MEEELFAVDEDDRPLALALVRSAAIRNELWRRTAGGVAIDRERQLVLCHRRSVTKDERAGYWVATFGGKIHFGEHHLTAATRELLEEFTVVAKTMVFAGKFRSEQRRQFEYVYLASVESTGEVVVDPDEVAEFDWLPAARVIDALARSDRWYVYGYEATLIEQHYKT